MKIKYVGPYDFRVLGAEDASRAGVEGFKKTTWAQGQTHEVTAAVGAWLLSLDGFREEKPAADTSRSGASAKRDG